MQTFYSFLRSLGVMLALSLALSSAAHAQVSLETSPAAVKDFVRQVYIEGVPYEEASRLSPDVAVPVLIRMLNDPREEEHWANVVVTLGMLGDDRVVQPLLDFIRRGESRKQLSPSQSRAKIGAVMALGYAVNKRGNRKALAYLKEGIDPRVWEKRKVGWASGFFSSPAERDNQLAIMSAIGLGLSGHPEAAEVLRSLREPPTTPDMRALRTRLADMSNIADEALKAHSTISREGLKRYYQRTVPDDAPDRE